MTSRVMFTKAYGGLSARGSDAARISVLYGPLAGKMPHEVKKSAAIIVQSLANFLNERCKHRPYPVHPPHNPLYMAIDYPQAHENILRPHVTLSQQSLGLPS